jgi:hypothetical protein
VTTAQSHRIPEVLRQLSYKTLIVVALLFTIFQVTWSFRNHRLALEPWPDDDFYLCDAMQRIQVLDQHGAIAFVQNLFADPPHSPFSSGVCLLGLLFGIQGLVGPYLVSGLLVFIFLAEADRLTNNLSSTAKWILIAGLLLIPFARLMVVELRPDFAVGLFGAMGCLRLSQMILRSRSPDRREIVVCSLALALTLLAKPTFFPHTIVIVGSTIIISLFFRELVDNRLASLRWSALFSRFKPCAWSIAGCIVLVLPYYVFGYRLVWDYIAECIWGNGNWRWQVEGGVGGSLHYYLSGAGMSSIGAYCNLSLAIVFFGLVYLALRRRFYEAAELAVGVLLTVISATVIILGGIGNPTFNLTAQLFLVLTAVIALNYILVGVRYVQALAVLPVLLVGLFQTPLSGNMDRERLANRGIATKVVEAIEAFSAGNPTFPARPISVAMPGYALLHDSALWILSHNRGFDIEAYDLGDYSDLETVMTKLATADFVCLSETPNAPKGFVRIDGELFARFKTDQQFEFKSRIPFGNQAIWLYQRRTNSKP